MRVNFTKARNISLQSSMRQVRSLGGFTLSRLNACSVCVCEQCMSAASRSVGFVRAGANRMHYCLSYWMLSQAYASQGFSVMQINYNTVHASWPFKTLHCKKNIKKNKKNLEGRKCCYNIF